MKKDNLLKGIVTKVLDDANQNSPEILTGLAVVMAAKAGIRAKEACGII